MNGVNEMKLIEQELTTVAKECFPNKVKATRKPQKKEPPKKEFVDPYQWHGV